MNGFDLARALKATPVALQNFGVDVAHHFCGSAGWNPYIHEARMPAGCYIGQHTHLFDHLAVLVSGKARVWTAGEATQHEGYVTLPPFKANVEHGIEAITDCIWLCVWATNETTPEAFEAAVVKE